MKAKRSYVRRGIAWLDPVAVREFNKLAQRAWRLRNAPRKGKRVGQ